MPNPYTGTDNDPFQEAQHRFLGPEWERYFGSLKGKNVRFVNPTPVAGGTGELRPGDLDTARSNATNAYLNQLTDQGRGEAQQLRQMTAGADIAEAQARGVVQQEQDQEQARRAMEGYGTAPAEIMGEPGGPLMARPSGVPLPPAEARAQALAKMPLPIRQAYEKQYAAQDAQAAAADLASRKQTEVEQANRAKESANAPFAAPVDAHGVPLTGDAVLATLPPSKQKLVQSVLEGRQAIPSGTALKDPYWKGVLETANLVDPNFDTVNFNARANTRKDFTSGAASKQINAINTVVGHLHDLASEGDKLGNTGLNWVNRVYNAVTPGGSTRGVTLNNFETLKEGVATELMRTWRQVGAGSEKEIEDWKSTITSAKSPEELRGAFTTVGGMLESKLDAIDSQYKQGMGTDKVSAITPESRKRLDALRGGAVAPRGAAPGAAPKAADPLGIR